MKHITTNPAIKWIRQEEKDSERDFRNEVYRNLFLPRNYELRVQPIPDERTWPYEPVPVSQVEIPRERRSFWRRLWERK